MRLCVGCMINIDLCNIKFFGMVLILKVCVLKYVLLCKCFFLYLFFYRVEENIICVWIFWKGCLSVVEILV